MIRDRKKSLIMSMLALGTYMTIQLYGVIDYSKIGETISTGVTQGVNGGIKVISAQSDLFSFIVFVGVISVLAGVIFYFLNKIRGRR